MWWIYLLIVLFLLVILSFTDNVRYFLLSRKVKASSNNDVIKEEDLNHLPPLLKGYLVMAGVVGQEKIIGMRVKLSGQMKVSRDHDFTHAKAKQTSMFFPQKRYFYMQLRMKHVLVKGIHIFHKGLATMTIKVLGLLRVVHVKGDKMNQAETVTILNDMCLMAPHALIDANISYKELDDHTLLATFTNEGITIQAKLIFDEQGKLINFISNDRYYSADGQEQISVPWITPIKRYRYNDYGLYLPYKGDAVWAFDDEMFTYFKLTVAHIKYIS